MDTLDINVITTVKCNDKKAKIVSIPKGVNHILPKAFYKCAVTKLTIPDTVTSIGREAFMYSDIKDITLSQNLLTISPHTFDSCKNLKSITLPDNIIVIGQDAFANCINLEHITLPESLKRLSLHTFLNCPSLHKLRIPPNVEYLSRVALSDTEYLTELTVAGKNTEIRFAKSNFTDNFTIIAPDDSKAHKFATDNNIAYKRLM